MISTTISKIKQACTTVFVPRLFQYKLGYSPCIYAAFSKFEKFTSSVKSAQKSTKATGDDEPLQILETPLKDGFSVVSLREPQEISKNDDSEVRNAKRNITNLNVPNNDSATATLSYCSSTSRYDKCTRVISEIFGETDAPRKNMLLNHVNMFDNINGKLVTDKNTQINIFGKCDSKNFKTTSHVKIGSTTDNKNSRKSKDKFKSVLYYEGVLTKEKQDNHSTESNKLTECKNEVSQQLNSCLYDVDPDEYISTWKIDPNTLKLVSNAKSVEEIDAYWTDVYHKAIEDNTAHTKPNQAIDLETPNVFRCLKDDFSNSKDASISKRISHTPEEQERILSCSPYDRDLQDATLKSTTNKQDEETLAQKLEHIDEVPLVEAEKIKIEGLSVPPKVLGNMDKPKVTDINNKNLDEVANRCLNLPYAQVDKVLLKEIESLDIPVIKHVQGNTDNIELSKTYKFTKTSGKSRAAKVDFSNDSQMPYNVTGLGGIKLNPSTLQAEEHYRQSLINSKATSKTFTKNILSNIVPPDACTEKILNINYSHKEDASDGTPDKSLLNQHNELSTKQKPSGKSDHYLTENILPNDRFDPKHILTCNETCAISPKSIMNTDDLSNLEDTEATFERSILSKYMTAQKKKENEKAQKLRLLTDEGCGCFELREINRARLKLKNANAKQAKSLDYYVKMMQSGNTEMTDKPSTCEDSIKKMPATSTTTIERIYAPEMPSIINNRQKPSTKHDEQFTNNNSGSIKGPESVKSFSIELSESVSSEAKDIFPADLTPNTTEFSTVEKETTPYAANEKLKANVNNEEVPDAHLLQSIEATNKKLQATSDQLRVTSEQLLATSEQLEVSTEQLHATSEQLQTTSAKLDVTCEKIIDLNNVKYADSQVLSSKKKEDSDPVIDNPWIDNPVYPIDPSVEPLKPTAKPSIESPAEPPEIPEITTILKSKEMDLDQKDANTNNSKVNKASNAGATLSSALPVSGKTPPSLSDVKDNIKLSELMKLVKERNQERSAEHLLTKPPEAKKNVPSMQLPRHKLPVYKTPAYPYLKPKPNICTTTKKSDPKKMNFSQYDKKTLGIDHDLRPRFIRNEIPENNNICQSETQQDVTLANTLPSANLSEDIMVQLENIGYILESACQRGKDSLESAALAKTRFLRRPKNYEPWTPIPSWPIPKKNKHKKLQCPSDGCPAPPPRSVHDSPCGLKTCSTFPTNPKRTFSVLDYCTIAFSDPIFVDIGEF